MYAFNKVRFPPRLFFRTPAIRFVTVWRKLCFSGKPFGKGKPSAALG